MTKPKKMALINTSIDKIMTSILEQRKIIQELELEKNQALLCAKNYQYDINLLKKVIHDMKLMIKPRTPMQKPLPLPLGAPYVNRFKKKAYFSLVNLNKMKVNEIVCSIKYSENGYFLAFATYKTLYLYDSNSKLCINSVTIPFDPNSVIERLTRTIAFAPNSLMVAICAADFSVILYRVPSLKLIGKLQTKSKVVSFISFFNDNEHIVTTGENARLTVWSVRDLSKEREIVLAEKKAIVGISITLDDLTLIVTCSDGSVYILNTNFEDTPACYDAQCEFLFSSAVSRSGSHLALSLRTNAVKLFSLIGGFHFLGLFVGHSDFVVCVEFSSNGKLLFTGSKDESIKIWNLENSENLFTIRLNENTVFCVSHHPKKNEFVCCTGDGTIAIFSYVCEYR